jgi:DNA polymerase III subunit gamma/tau
MSYLVLARKYRPQTFEDLVGQEHVTTTLLNALEAGRVAHAYVFSGPRGCGKTTTARLLAKALNCVKGPTAKPCGECPQCRVIATGASPDDVLEIDGASNRGIDQIRELRDTVKYAPARSRYRIFIIDEAHQITDQGFNALLKTLEEPPPHAVFMMATTEAQKIPPTILSRCQRFQLKPIPPSAIRDQLVKIAKQENLKADEESLREVARAAHGSLRDALSLLDQLVAYCPNGITGKDVSHLLGLLPRETVRRFQDVLAKGSQEEVLQAVQKAVEDGFDLFQLGHDLMENWHQRLLWKSGVRNPSLGDPGEMEKNSARDTLPALERNLQLISHCLEQMRRSESPRVTFELCCLELAQDAVSVEELLNRLERLESSLRDGGSAPLKKKPDLIRPVSASAVPTEPVPAVAEERSSVSSAIRSAASAPETNGKRPHANGVHEAPLRPDQVRTAWVRMIEAIGKAKPLLEPFLLSARWEVSPPNLLIIYCSQDFQMQQIESNLPRIKEFLAENLPVPFLIQCRVAPKPVPPAGLSAATDEEPIAADAEEAVDEVLVEQERASTGLPTEPYVPAAEAGDEFVSSDSPDLDPGIKKVLDKFPGKLRRIPPAGSA